MPATPPGIAGLLQRTALTACFAIPALVSSDVVPERFMFPKLLAGEVFILAVLMAWPFLDPRRRLELHPRTLVVPILAVAAANSMLACMQYAGMPLWETTREGRHVVYGTFGNPVLLAEFLAPAAVLGIAAALSARLPGGRWAAGGTAALCAVAMLLTETRSAWISLGTGLAVLAVLAAEARQRKLALAGIAAIAIVVAAWSPVRSRVLLGVSGHDPGIANRTFMWRVALEMFREHPVLGIGWGEYGHRYLDYAAKLQEEGRGRPWYPGITAYAHSDPLQLLAETGQVGAGIAMFLLGWWVWLAVRGLRGLAGASRGERAAGAAVVAAILAESVVAYPFRDFPVAALFLWGLAAGVPFGATRERPASRLIRVVPFLIALLVTPSFFIRPFVSAAYLESGTARPDGVPILERGLKIAPGSGELRFRLGMARLREGRLDDAAAEFEQAVWSFPDPDVRFNLGFIALRKNDFPRAEEWFREGLRRYPYFKAPAWADYALALAGLGRREEARKAAERALEIDPGLGRARVFLSELGKKGRKR